MDMTGEYRIAAPRETVWAALNDPDVLRSCIAGCETLDKTSDTGFTAKVKAKVGPVSASFSGKVNLTDIDPPKGYRIVGEGTGGAAGFAKGGATVALAEDGPDATVLTYTAEAQVGGKLAQIGSRLIQGTAKKMADDFFAKFAEAVGGPAADATPATADVPAAAEPAIAAAAVASAAGVYEPPPQAAAPPATDAPTGPAASARTAPPPAVSVLGGVPQPVWIAIVVAAVAIALWAVF
jgi:carbon monoxide dehydrogenase subunit G